MCLFDFQKYTSDKQRAWSPFKCTRENLSASADFSLRFCGPVKISIIAWGVWQWAPAMKRVPEMMLPQDTHKMAKISYKLKQIAKQFRAKNVGIAS